MKSERIKLAPKKRAGADDKHVEILVRVKVYGPDVAHLQNVLEHCACASEGAHFPKVRTLSDLLSMLCDDVAHVSRRPGSWEGANMAQVLSGHGFFNE